jgi:hypothetical protein
MKTCPLPPLRPAASHEFSQHHERDHLDQPYDVPDSLPPTEDPDEPSDLDDFDAAPDDDTRWDVFIPDDDEYDRDPDLSDFEASMEPRAWSKEPE